MKWIKEGRGEANGRKSGHIHIVVRWFYFHNKHCLLRENVTRCTLFHCYSKALTLNKTIHLLFLQLHYLAFFLSTLYVGSWVHSTIVPLPPVLIIVYTERFLLVFGIHGNTSLYVELAVCLIRSSFYSSSNSLVLFEPHHPLQVGPLSPTLLTAPPSPFIFCSSSFTITHILLCWSIFCLVFLWLINLAKRDSFTDCLQ